MRETSTGRVWIAAQFRLPVVLLALSPHARALAARAGVIAQFWHVEARTTAAVPLMSSPVVCGFPSPAGDERC